MKSIYAFLAIGALLTLLPSSGQAAVTQKELNNGYALLHKLCEQEKQVDLILIVKTTPPKVADFLHVVAKNADHDLGMLARMQAADPAMKFDDRGLPMIEEQTRESIKTDKQHTLLFGATGGDFTKTLLITQVEAATYGQNMASVMADEEPNARHAADLRGISDRWKKIRDQAYAMIYAL